MPKTKIIPKCSLDKFYTNRDEVVRLLSLIDVTDYDLIIEPSAGDGAFLDNLNHNNIIAYDISPQHKDIIQQSWFDVEIESTYDNVCVIGNPPFGTFNKLTKDFIKHALSFSNVTTIAFIMPKTWRKPTLQKTFPKNWSLVLDEDVTPNSFIFEDDEYHVETTFQVWKKGKNTNNLRWKFPLVVTHEDFSFSNKEDADFFIMGASPSTIKQKDDVSPSNRGYWIKSNIDVDELKLNFKSINWNNFGCSSVSGGVYWVSQPEMVSFYTTLYGEQHESKKRISPV